VLTEKGEQHGSVYENKKTLTMNKKSTHKGQKPVAFHTDLSAIALF
jgi:hypothetical protein